MQIKQREERLKKSYSKCPHRSHRTITYRHSWRKWQRTNAIREVQGLPPSLGGGWQVTGKASVCMLWDQFTSIRIKGHHGSTVIIEMNGAI